ncbi:MAG: hypothetical protein HW390_211 [Candidatus Brocadiaceae bacterium]|nr:hypothetical protein [Candidatus Brocadiaceae bacterium]
MPLRFVRAASEFYRQKAIDVMKESKRYYFVDEAGDLTLFNKRGSVLIGQEGCSSYFILGVAHITNPHDVRKRLDDLRSELLSDSYLKDIPSFHSKTKLSFHAKDDCPEVRKDVYKLISSMDIKVYGIVRRKKSILKMVQKQNQYDKTWKYNQNSIYDSCVKRIFKDRLHSAEENYVTFARRGKSDRNKMLFRELSKAIRNFEKTSGKTVHSLHQVSSNYPSNEPCLQVIDYFLWALQRLYERHEDRYFNYLREKFIRIIDLDDKRFKDYGVYYDSRNVLTVSKRKDSLVG